MPRKPPPPMEVPTGLVVDDKEVVKKMRATFIGRLERLADETKNPLYMWEAIIYCHAFDFPLTDGCLSYIFSVAGEIHELVAAASTWAYCAKHLEIFEPTLTPQQAVSRIPSALGIVDGTRNGFERMASDREHIEDFNIAWSADVFSQIGKNVLGIPSPEEAEKIIIKRRNLASKRAARARVRKGASLQDNSNGRKLPP